MIDDVIVVGAGAAGLMAAVSAAETGAAVRLLNAHPKPGLKILMSGGTRCNVTNEVVDPESFEGGSRPAIGIVLKAFSAAETRRWFEELGVALKLEPEGKYFPVTDSARTVLEALLRRAEDLGVAFEFGAPVTAIEVAAPDRTPGAANGAASTAAGDAPDAPSATTFFRVVTPSAAHHARAVILATGGLSFPKTGSDGSGHGLARALGHTIVPTSPALTPLTLSGDLHRRLQGVTLPAGLTLFVDGRKRLTRTGSLLFTHFGLSGPAALDLSRHWLRTPATSTRRVTIDFCPGERLDELEADWLRAAGAGPATIQSWLARRVPVRLARELAERSSIHPGLRLAQCPRDDRRRLLELMTACPAPVSGTLGYGKAEVTAGGVPLDEVDPRRMMSRRTPGLFLAGEILDVDGRLGGYNFQWAWSSGRVAGQAAAAWARGAGPVATAG